MSWSKSASGKAAEVKEQAALFGEQLAETDVQCADSVKAAHMAQAAAAAHAIGTIVDGYPEGSTFSISAWGTSSYGSGSNTLGLSYHVTLPVGQPVGVAG